MATVPSSHVLTALKLFRDGFHCSQSVIASFCEECGVTSEQALRMGACLGSGMRKGEVCGACTGALVVLGLLYGHCSVCDRASKSRSDKVNDMFMNMFADENGSCVCRELLGCDVSTAEGVKYAVDNRLFADFCPRMVKSAVDILERVISVNNIDNVEL